jgi:hypothetical protein
MAGERLIIGTEEYVELVKQQGTAHFAIAYESPERCSDLYVSALTTQHEFISSHAMIERAHNDPHNRIFLTTMGLWNVAFIHSMIVESTGRGLRYVGGFGMRPAGEDLYTKALSKGVTVVMPRAASPQPALPPAV